MMGRAAAKRLRDETRRILRDHVSARIAKRGAHYVVRITERDGTAWEFEDVQQVQSFILGQLR
ncbi:MAG: hypothetical protein ACRENJ_06225 [Candidatus Eiseniibacteriota bacterium]